MYVYNTNDNQINIVKLEMYVKWTHFERLLSTFEVFYFSLQKLAYLFHIYKIHENNRSLYTYFSFDIKHIMFISITSGLWTNILYLSEIFF